MCAAQSGARKKRTSPTPRLHEHSPLNFFVEYLSQRKSALLLPGHVNPLPEKLIGKRSNGSRGFATFAILRRNLRRTAAIPEMRIKLLMLLCFYCLPLRLITVIATVMRSFFYACVTSRKNSPWPSRGPARWGGGGGERDLDTPSPLPRHPGHISWNFPDETNTSAAGRVSLASINFFSGSVSGVSKVNAVEFIFRSPNVRTFPSTFHSIPLVVPNRRKPNPLARNEPLQS